VHDIPENKLPFIFASDKEYRSGIFDFVSKIEGQEMLKIFKMIRKERSKPAHHLSDNKLNYN